MNYFLGSGNCRLNTATVKKNVLISRTFLSQQETKGEERGGGGDEKFWVGRKVFFFFLL